MGGGWLPRCPRKEGDEGQHLGHLWEALGGSWRAVWISVSGFSVAICCSSSSWGGPSFAWQLRATKPLSRAEGGGSSSFRWPQQPLRLALRQDAVHKMFNVRGGAARAQNLAPRLEAREGLGVMV